MNKGKAYANRKALSERPASDFYVTPRALVWVAADVIKQEFDKKYRILDPCSGTGIIADELRGMGYMVNEMDINHYGREDSLRDNYLTAYIPARQVIANPPFSQWDDFVIKANRSVGKVMMLGRLNYFGTYQRKEKGIWQGLKWVLPFDRYVDFRTPERDDGLFHVGAMATAWFIWEMGWRWEPKLRILSVNKYAKLGAFRG